MSFVTWLKQSPFAAPWFDAILFGVLLFEVLPFFLRARGARIGFTAASLACQVGLLVSCLYLGAALNETLIVLTLAALFSAASSLLEYRLFDRPTVEEECKVKAAEAAQLARERAEEFVLPVAPPEKKPEPNPEREEAVSAPADGKTPVPATAEGGDNEQ